MLARALEAPSGALVVIDDGLIERALAASRASPRGRIILPFHRSHDEVFHRMLNAMQPGSYVQPHRHVTPPKAESILVVRGAIRLVSFTNEGAIEQRLTLRPATGPCGADVRPGLFHTFFALEPDSVVFEAKPGPYEPASDKDFASWAPPEGSVNALDYLRSIGGPSVLR
jgi:cupin fold WbuC family metalloprotein